MSADFAPFGPNSAFMWRAILLIITFKELNYTHTLAVVMRVLEEGGHQIPR